MAEEKLNLLKDFAPVSTETWKAKIVADLKGADFVKEFLCAMSRRGLGCKRHQVRRLRTRRYEAIVGSD